MRIAALTNVADDSRTMLCDGLTTRRMHTPRAHTNVMSVIAALPFTFYRKSVSLRTPGPLARG